MAKSSPKKTKRKYIDWDSIEPLYRAGVLSLHEICAQYEADHINSQVWKTTVTHAAIIKKAKAKKWTRNLAGKVRDRVKEKVVTGLVTGRNQEKNQGLSDGEIVDAAAEVGHAVITRHMIEIAALVEIENQLLKELSDSPKRSYMANFQGQIISKEVQLTVKEKSATLKDLADVRAKRIILERQAYNLDDEGGSGGEGQKEASTPEETLRRFAFMLRRKEEERNEH